LSSARIPLVDLRPFREGAATERAALVEQVGRVCTEIGFLAVTGHGVPDDVAGRAAEASRAFFDRPLAEKLALAADPVAPGLPVYRPIAAESLASSLGSEAPGDLKESLDYGPGLEGVGWPERVPELRPGVEDYFGAMLGLGDTLMRIFALALGLPEEHFAASCDGSFSSLRVINYPEPAKEALPGQLRAGAHRDYGCLTVLRTEAVAGGLQVRTRAGEWLDADPPPGAFVVNIGDLMARWTNDRWVSTLHRVVNPPSARRRGSRRQSLVFFHNPRADAVIEPIDAFTGTGEPKYPPITAGEYVLAKAAQALST
jgi:isopenicillin N synthase-like dioxygenase